jgi:hypothetical protein
MMFNGRSLPGHGRASGHGFAKRCIFGHGAAADGSRRGLPIASTGITEGGMGCAIGGRDSHACSIRGDDISTVGPSCGGRDSSDDGGSGKTTRRTRKSPHNMSYRELPL